MAHKAKEKQVQAKVKIKGTQAKSSKSPQKVLEHPPPVTSITIGGLPANSNGTRTHLTCELCGFEPVVKNRWQCRQDHLMRQHFFDKLQAAFPDMSVRQCPVQGCDFIGRDKQFILRHYAVQHRMNETWLTEALAQRGIVYKPVRLRARKGEPKKKPKPKLAFVINKPTMVQNYTCEKCGKKFDERCHLINHNRHVHLKYDDDEKKWLAAHRCDICGKMFVDVKYVKTHKNSVHFKIKNFECEICGKKFCAAKSVKAHQLKYHPAVKQETEERDHDENDDVASPQSSRQAQNF